MIFQSRNGVRFANSDFVIQQQWLDADPDSQLKLNPDELLEMAFREYLRLEDMSDYPFDEESQCGYAPFCKVLTIELSAEQRANPGAILIDRVKISEVNESEIVFSYESRAPGELRLPTRSYPCPRAERERANFLQVILYSDEQLAKEDKENPNRVVDANLWHVVLYRGQNTNDKLPMEDSTMLRNALGIEEGGSGVPIDPNAWEHCISHWEEYVKYAPCFRARMIIGGKYVYV